MRLPSSRPARADPTYRTCNPPGIVSAQLNSLLSLLIPSTSKSSTAVLLGVSERTLASAIQGQLHIPCDTGERTLELVRGIRLHAENLLAKAGTGIGKGDVRLAQLGLGHSYSRGKVKVSPEAARPHFVQHPEL